MTGPMTLREAAERTDRSVTTLRRYIRHGRLRAEMREGRYGPEYFVSSADLAEAGLDPRAGGTLALTPGSEALLDRLRPVLAESVPVSLFQELQMKHEQLLVQYGMVRAGGLRVLEMQAELDTKRRQIEESQAETVRVKERLASEAGELRRRLREAELELEGRRVEAAALREKVRGLEMLTRNTVTNEQIDRQFDDVMEQMRRVEHLTAEHDRPDRTATPWPARAPLPEPEH